MVSTGETEGRAAGSARAAGTRDALMDTAERLFAERGVYAVSNRQVGEAAGQANNTAVSYHFGTKTDLVRAIVDRHAADIDARRVALLEQVRGSTDIRDWIRCLVVPLTEHIASLGVPSRYARFYAQVVADPTLRALIYEDALTSDPVREVLAGLRGTIDDLPREIRHARARMGRHLLVHTCADRERLLADVGEAGAPPWDEFATDVVDAMVGMWTAPVTR